MAELNLQDVVTETVQVDADTHAAIQRGIADCDAGRSVPIEEVSEMIPKWISKFASPKSR